MLIYIGPNIIYELVFIQFLPLITGNMNVSYIISDAYGRSLPDKSLYRLTVDNRLTMFQSYPGNHILG